MCCQLAISPAIAEDSGAVDHGAGTGGFLSRGLRFFGRVDPSNLGCERGGNLAGNPAIGQHFLVVAAGVLQRVAVTLPLAAIAALAARLASPRASAPGDGR